MELKEEKTIRFRFGCSVFCIEKKELIAIGVSVVINCESCMEWHIKQAMDSGATENEIIEAIEVGIEMGGGPATVSARFAMNVLEFYGIETPVATIIKN